MTFRPSCVEDLARGVPEHPRLRVRAAGTKSGPPADDVTVCDISALSGIVEYQPEECTMTARAGTPLTDIVARLDAHRQWLPCDPPLVDAGASIGGTVATGLNGSCRYRFGGIRDFIIGARLVDGRGRIISSGGKVVKNAAGFLLHQALVGSCGTLGVLAEVTFKVFPAPEARVSVSVPLVSLAAGVQAIAALQRARIDAEAIDLLADADPARPWTLLVRLGGFSEALEVRILSVQDVLGAASRVHAGEQDDTLWQTAREFSWAPADTTLVRIPTTLPIVERLDAVLSAPQMSRRYAVAGNLALVAWPGPLDTLDLALQNFSLTGQVVRGPAWPATGPFIGAGSTNAFSARLRGVLDPDGRF